MAVATVPLPKYHEFMWPTLRALKELGGSGTIQEIAQKVIELEGFSEQQQAMIHNDGPRTEIEYRLAWARTYLRLGGAVENPSRGLWSLNEKGRTLEKEGIREIVREVSRQGRRTRDRGGQGRADEGGGGSAGGEGDAEVVDTAWKEELLSVLLDMPPDRFEHLCQRLLRAVGFTKVAVTGRSGDGGIDGIGTYRWQLITFPLFFQCKRYREAWVPPRSATSEERWRVVGTRASSSPLDPSRQRL
jgi:restriction system protein